MTKRSSPRRCSALLRLHRSSSVAAPAGGAAKHLQLFGNLCRSGGRFASAEGGCARDESGRGGQEDRACHTPQTSSSPFPRDHRIVEPLAHHGGRWVEGSCSLLTPRRKRGGRTCQAHRRYYNLSGYSMHLIYTGWPSILLVGLRQDDSPRPQSFLFRNVPPDSSSPR